MLYKIVKTVNNKLNRTKQVLTTKYKLSLNHNKILINLKIFYNKSKLN